MNQVRKIALEEHFNAPGFESYSEVFLKNIPVRVRKELSSRLNDFDDLRLADMDKAGVEKVLLSQSGPGVQAEQDTILAIRKAQENNDFLADRIARNPDRYAGFATLPMQDPKAAAAELERAVKQLGFKGSMVNGHTLGVYYDDPIYDPFWEIMQELDVPMYLHPVNFHEVPHNMVGQPILPGAVWGWGVETGTHALRLLFGGVFDRFPKLKVVLGHMGEGLPFMRWRFDSRFAVYSQGISLDRPPSAYIGSNILITTSGVCSAPTLIGAIGEMGPEAVMFSIDYPYESSELAAEFIEQAPLDERTRALVCYDNAKRIFKL
jgi:2,3-dihydroxybenzoate decarboxylase